MLRPYQEAGAEWLASNVHAVLADQMGLGKTIQAITAADKLSLRRIMVICPAVARMNWVREFKRFSLYQRDFLILDEKEAATGQKYRDRCLVMSYERAVSLQESGFFENQFFNAMILDESHYLKNPYSKRTQKILGRTGVQTCAKYIWCLTGTPITKDIGDLWPFLYCFGVTKLKFNSFLFRHCITKPDANHWAIPRVIGLKPGALLKMKPGLDKVCLRRTVQEVLPELPPVIHEEILVERGHVPLTDEMRAIIDGEINTLSEAITNNQAIGILEMVAKSCSTLRRYLGMQKLEPAITLVKEELAAYTHKIVLFTIHKAVAEGLQAAFSSPNGNAAAVVTGAVTSAADRQAAIDRFQTDPTCRVFIANISAAGTAITLTAAHHVIFVEQEWTPAQNEQAISRCHRIGQAHPVLVRTLTVANSIDEAVSRVLNRRKKHVSEIISS